MCVSLVYVFVCVFSVCVLSSDASDPNHTQTHCTINPPCTTCTLAPNRHQHLVVFIEGYSLGRPHRRICINPLLYADDRGRERDTGDYCGSPPPTIHPIRNNVLSVGNTIQAQQIQIYC